MDSVFLKVPVARQYADYAVVSLLIDSHGDVLFRGCCFFCTELPPGSWLNSDEWESQKTNNNTCLFKQHTLNKHVECRPVTKRCDSCLNKWGGKKVVRVV